VTFVETYVIYCTPFVTFFASSEILHSLKYVVHSIFMPVFIVNPEIQF